jgi:hypothetical protein
MRIRKVKEFYIGYLEKSPPGLAKWLRVIIPLSFLILILSGWLVAWFQPKSERSNFEYGVYKELTGTIITDPVPMLWVRAGMEDRKTDKLFLLGVFGKKGARELVDRYAATVPGKLEQYRVTVRGSLIYYAGKTMFELDHDLASFIKAEPRQQDLTFQRSLIGDARITGEILDTKCFLGVMKPGRGKPHRSCAVRCIAGGVPMAVSIQTSKDEDYALLLDENGNLPNSEVYGLIGKQVMLSGKMEQWADWKVFRISSIRQALNPSGNITSPPAVLSHNNYIAAQCN